MACSFLCTCPQAQHAQPLSVFTRPELRDTRLGHMAIPMLDEGQRSVMALGLCGARVCTLSSQGSVWARASLLTQKWQAVVV